jgi:NitT/TauT family transport system permease protein
MSVTRGTYDVPESSAGVAEMGTPPRQPVGGRSPVRRVLETIRAPLVALVVILGVWYLTIAIFDISPFLIPPPHVVAQEFLANWEILLQNGWVTMVEALGGLGLSILIGVILAVLIAEIPPFSRAVMPWLVMSQAVPKVAIAPLFVIWFGFDLTPKIVVAFFISFFPVVISTASGLRSVSPEEVDLFRTISRRRWPLYRHLKIPRALPQFFDGVKVGTTLALIGAVVGEFISAQEGLGYMVLIANRNLQTSLMFAIFVALSFIGIVLFYAVVLVERLVIPWHFAARAGAETGEEV